MDARLSPSQIRTMRRQIHEGKQRGVSNRAIGGLAEALRTTPEWLILGTGPKELENEDVSEGPKVGKATASLPLVGAVGAGLWLEAAEIYSDLAERLGWPQRFFDADVIMTMRGEHGGIPWHSGN